MGRAGLGIVVGAFFFASTHVASAQVVVPPGSEVPIPPKPQTDSAAPKPDTIKAPFQRLAPPRTTDTGPQFEWNREALYSSGAYTLADLLERIPGATSFRTGWLASPKFVAVNGDLMRVKVVYDGLEVDNLDPRSGEMLDLTTIDLWTLENVMIERFANELRVHVTSWRVEKTDPYTRTDVYTGDEDTNIYRGFYGKRWGSGFGLQLGGQQFNTRSARFGGGGDALSFIARAGIARARWSIDAFATRRNAARVIQPTFGSGLSLPPFEGTQTIAYVRAGAGNPASGPWVHAIASNMRLGEESQHVSPADAFSRKLRADTTDTTTKRIQYLAAAGLTHGPFRGSIADRIKAFDGEVTHHPELRLELGGRIAAIDLFAQRDGRLKRRRADGIVRFTPLSFIAITGAASYDSPDNENDTAVFRPDEDSTAVAPVVFPKSLSARVELGIRLWNPWLIGGFVTRDTALLTPPTVVDSAYQVRNVGRRRGVYAGLRGKVFKDVNFEVLGTRWDSAGYYQPKYQSRAEVFLDTRWLSRFPSGSFGLKLAAIHEYRDVVRFPSSDGDRFTAASNIASALVEIRILRGVATYQVRNIFGKNYQIFPDFYMPRSLGVYGLRWEFWN